MYELSYRVGFGDGNDGFFTTESQRHRERQVLFFAFLGVSVPVW